MLGAGVGHSMCWCVITFFSKFTRALRHTGMHDSRSNCVICRSCVDATVGAVQKQGNNVGLGRVVQVNNAGLGSETVKDYKGLNRTFYAGAESGSGAAGGLGAGAAAAATNELPPEVRCVCHSVCAALVWMASTCAAILYSARRTRNQLT